MANNSINFVATFSANRTNCIAQVNRAEEVATYPDSWQNFKSQLCRCFFESSFFGAGPTPRDIRSEIPER